MIAVCIECSLKLTIYLLSILRGEVTKLKLLNLLQLPWSIWHLICIRHDKTAAVKFCSGKLMLQVYALCLAGMSNLLS